MPEQYVHTKFTVITSVINSTKGSVMEKKEKRPVKNKSTMTAGDIYARDYASCKLARQFWSLLYGARMKDRTQINGDI